MTDVAEPAFELPEFDDAALRKAIRRGIWRVVARSVVWILVLAILWPLGWDLAYSATGRSERFETVIGGALVVTHPDLQLSPDGFDASPTLLGGMRMDNGGPRHTATGTANGSVLEISQNLLGHVDPWAALPGGGPVYELLRGEAPTKEATRALLDQLPDATTSLVVVELATPAPGRPDWHPDGRLAGFVWYEPPYAADRPDALDEHRSNVLAPLGWPTVGVGTRFTDWARELRESDSDNLSALKLPDVSVIRAVARRNRVHGYLESGVSKERVRALLDDPAVASVAIVEVALRTSLTSRPS